MTRARLITLLVVAVAADALALRLGWLDHPLPRLAGPEAWTCSRAAGVIAFVALTLDVLFGLFVSTGALDRWVPRAASVDVHRWLSVVALTLIGVHAVALLADSWVKYDALDLVVPGLSSYRTGPVAIGILAMYGALLVHQSFGWRKRIGVRAWRALHFIAFAVFVAAVAHGVLAGTDARHPGMRALYLGAGVTVGALVALRIAGAIALAIQRCIDRRNRLSPATARAADRGAPGGNGSTVQSG